MPVRAPLIGSRGSGCSDGYSARSPLEDQFRNPPNSARPRVWWHWLNGNITKDGIANDLAWMKRVGIGGLQNFDANLNTPAGGKGPVDLHAPRVEGRLPLRRDPGLSELVSYRTEGGETIVPLTLLADESVHVLPPPRRR